MSDCVVMFLTGRTAINDQCGLDAEAELVQQEETGDLHVTYN